MKSWLIKTCCVAGILFSGIGQAQEARTVHGILEVDPLSILMSPDVDGFSASYRSSSRYSYSSKTETINGIGSWAPMVRGGVQFDSRKMSTAVTLGGGALVNGAFTAPMASLDCNVRFHMGRIVTLGPHVALVAVGDPSWQGDADVTLSSTSGAEAGLDLTVGKRVAFAMQLNYLALAPMDAEAGSGWRTSDDQLNLSGVMLKLGVMFKF